MCLLRLFASLRPRVQFRFPPPPALLPIPGFTPPFNPTPAQTQSINLAKGQLNTTEKEIIEEQQLQMIRIVEQQLLVNETLRKELREADQKKTAGEPKREAVIIVGK